MAINWSTIGDEMYGQINHSDMEMTTPIARATATTNRDSDTNGRESRLWRIWEVYASKNMYVTPFSKGNVSINNYGGLRLCCAYSTGGYENEYTYPIEQEIIALRDIDPPSSLGDFPMREKDGVLKYVTPFCYTDTDYPTVRIRAMFPYNALCSHPEESHEFYIDYIHTGARKDYGANLIASILVNRGLARSAINTTKFDYAASVGAVLNHTGTANKSIADELKTIIQSDTLFPFLYVDYEGKISYMNQKTPSGVGVDTDSCIGAIAIETVDSHLVNSIQASWGMPYLVLTEGAGNAPTVIVDDENGDIVDPTVESSSGTGKFGEYKYEAKQDFSFSKALEYDREQNKWKIDSVNNSNNDASIEKYGNVGLRNKDDDFAIIDSELVQEKESIQYYFIFDEVDAEDALERVCYENRPKRQITITQDMMGMDFDIGYCDWGFDVGTEIAGNINGVINNMRCIERTTDFNNLTVESVWLESFLPDPTA